MDSEHASGDVLLCEIESHSKSLPREASELWETSCIKTINQYNITVLYKIKLTYIYIEFE